MDPFYRPDANIMPQGGRRSNHPYHVEGPDLQGLIGENPQFFHVLDLNLVTAQAFTSVNCEFNISGHGLVIYGYDPAKQYDPIANTGIETNVTTAFIACRFQQNFPSSGATAAATFTAGLQGYNEFHLKHNRGYWGPFSRFYLAWPAQAGTAVKIYIFKSKDYPFFTGEAST